jgi:hypothetical protein
MVACARSVIPSAVAYPIAVISARDTSTIRYMTGPTGTFLRQTFIACKIQVSTKDDNKL